MATITGTAANDTLTGGVADDRLIGLAGADRLEGGAGDDSIEGGTGNDIAVFGGVLADYRFAQFDGWLIVTDLNPTDGSDGSDRIRLVESLQFADVRIDLASGGEVRVNTTTASHQLEAQIARLDGGGHVVVWTGYGQDGDGPGIYAQRFGADGMARGDEFRVNTATVDYQWQPALAALEGGGFVVTWATYAIDPFNADIVAQLYNANGTAVGGEFTVNTVLAEQQAHPVATGLADGGFVIAWESYEQDGDLNGVIAQRFDADGSAVGEELTVNQTVTDSQSEPRVAATPDGGWIAVWSSFQQDGSSDGVYARRFDADGQPGAEFRVNTTTQGEQSNPAIAVREDGTWAVAWQSYVDDDVFYDCMLQVFAADGTPIGGEVRVNATGIDNQYEPALVFLGSGELLASWSALPQDGSGDGIYARVFTIDADTGATGGAEFHVATRTLGDQYGPALARFDDDGFVVSWVSIGQDGSGEGVYLQHFLHDDGDTRSPAAPWSFELPLLQGGTGAQHFDLTGAGGNLAAAGGRGNDTYVLDNGTDRAIELSGQGVDRVETALAWSLEATPAIENLRLLASDDVAATGNALGNHLWGNTGRNSLRGLAGSDTLEGGFGLDTLAGGSGNDTYVLIDAGDLVIERTGAGIDTLRSALRSTVLPANIERLQLFDSGSLDGFGNVLDNVLRGSAIGNLLDGRAGDDTMHGGRGDDIYRVDADGDRVVEQIGEGIDTVRSLVAFTLGPHVEQLKLDGDAALNGSGNFLANVIEGNSGANVLDGGTGADVLIGLAGDDTYHVDQGADTVIEAAGEGYDTVVASEDFTAPLHVELVRFVDAPGGARDYTGTGNDEDNLLEGAAGDDALNGLGGNDTLVGNAGDDTLIGGNGVDSMQGGIGNDSYRVDETADIVVELPGQGDDTVESSVDFTLSDNVERLRLTGVADIDGTGNELDNHLTGNSGSNSLVGAAGSDTLNGGGEREVDTMEGGLGDDTYFVDNEDDVAGQLEEPSDPGPLAGAVRDPNAANAGSNIDTVISLVSYTLSANIENLELSGSSDLDGRGNDQNNLLSGNSGNNLLNGRDGADLLDGGLGNDTLDGGAGGDTLAGGAGNDVYIVTAGDRILGEGATQGADTVRSAQSWTLGNNLEHLVLSGSSAVDASGNGAANTLGGNGAANTLAGLGGADALLGLGGSDTLAGGAGRDTLSGGTGADSFRFDSALGADNVDVLGDFVTGVDTIVLDDDVFTALAIGALAPEAFHASTGNAAHDADDRIVYNTSTGALFYDPDGTGAAAAVRFATLGTTTHPVLAAGDFQIVG